MSICSESLQGTGSMYHDFFSLRSPTLCDIFRVYLFFLNCYLIFKQQLVSFLLIKLCHHFRVCSLKLQGHGLSDAENIVTKYVITVALSVRNFVIEVGHMLFSTQCRLSKTNYLESFFSNLKITHYNSKMSFLNTC